MIKRKPGFSGKMFWSLEIPFKTGFTVCDEYRVLVEKSEGKIPLGRPRRRWEDNIKMDLQEVGCGGME